MRKILIPIDFSVDSINALDYAIEIANTIEAEILIMHVMTGKDYPHYIADHMGSVNTDTIEDAMRILVEQKKGQYTVQNGVFDYKIRTGNVVKEISNQSKYDDTTIIVVGAHGASGFEDNWIGSNSYRLVSHCPCPVLTIRNSFKFKGLKKIILPIDITHGSRLKVPAAAGLAKVFHSEVIVVGLRESNYTFIFNRVRADVNQVQKFLQKELITPVTTEMLSGKGIVDKLIDFSKENDGDMIIMHLLHSSNPLDNLVNFNANNLVNKSNTPVLFIPTKE